MDAAEQHAPPICSSVYYYIAFRYISIDGASFFAT